MKKVWIILLCAALLFAGCTSTQTATTETKTEAATSETATEAATEPVTEAEATASGDENKADVIIIGAGGTGMAAALSASEAGASVIILEKMPYVGGNTVRAKGGMNAVGTEAQKAAGIDDSVESFVEDTMTGGKNLNDKDLVTFLAENSNATVEWLTGLGADLSEVAKAAGASAARMHRPVGGADVGPMLVKVLSDNIAKTGQVRVDLDTTAEAFIMEGDKVIGVSALNKAGETVDYFGDTVILASGGFGAAPELYTKYRPDLQGMITTNHSGATGDGLVMAETTGAALVDVDRIQILFWLYTQCSTLEKF